MTCDSLYQLSCNYIAGISDIIFMFFLTQELVPPNILTEDFLRLIKNIDYSSVRFSCQCYVISYMISHNDRYIVQ